MNLGMMKTILGAMGFDAPKMEKEIVRIAQNVQYSTAEIAAQGAMIRSLCKHADLPVIPQAPLPNQEIEHDEHG